MRKTFSFLLALLVSLPLLAYAGTLTSWQPIAPGIFLATFPLMAKEGALLVLKIDPHKVHFELCSAAADAKLPLSLLQWAKTKQLLAVINASMYLPDNRTSTGYMRQGMILNNPRIAKKFGAFFVACPDNNSLPKATILERETRGLQEKLRHYHLVIQNYRLINSAKQVLWPKVGPKHTIAAVGLTAHGDILFLYSMHPTTPYTLAQELLRLPLDIGTTMYVEGGTPAGLFVNHPAYLALNLPFLFQSPLAPQLPNVLGIKSKTPSN
ncbi:MAG: phosphodiester glycosidase family protein [Desulfovibrionaceae bacterium]|nr:phosphodiester glycosidase family protein [Desulfovibrionaceae bacterium]